MGTRITPRRAARALPALLAILSMGGCASQPANSGAGPAPADPAAQAVATPLRDANLAQAPIPPVLVAAAGAPYAPPADDTCTGLQQQIAALTAVLGPDLDAPASSHGTALGHAANDALQDTVEGVIPFRGWLRRLSGAERAEKRHAAAIAAGMARRAYLKGILYGRNCLPYPTPPAPPAAAAARD